MCGIAGIIHRHPDRICLKRLNNAATALRHRGPDDYNVSVHGHVGLVHTRLSIIDLEGGRQPLETEDRQLTLVANGEIYNYLELFADWEAQGRKLRTRSDSEAILHAFAEKGLDGLKALNGMFAFALYDRQAESLILGRDRLGIKPLFYSVQPDFIAFASEMKGLLAILPKTPPLDTVALVQYLENTFNSGINTIFKGVYRVPPGCCLVISRDLSVNMHRYWSATDVRPSKLSQPEAEEQFESLLPQVMKEHLRSDVPYGLFLSGGIDSAVLCALLNQYQSQPLRTFSVGYKNVTKHDELQDAQRIASLFGTRHEALYLDTETLFRRIPHMIHSTDELMLDKATLPTSLLAEQAARDLKVVFSGEGGDEIFAGYGRYRKNGVQHFLSNVVAPGSGGFRIYGQWPAAMKKTLFRPALNRHSDARRAPFIASWKKTPRSWSHMQRAQFTDIETALADGLLVKVDRALMSFGIEGRVPFLDHRLVEFGLGLPDRLKVQGRVGKYFLRRWALRYLPHDHLFKDKRGFHVPVNSFFTPAVLQQLACLLPNNRAIREYFVPEEVRNLIRRHEAGHSCGGQLLPLLQFAIWHRMFIEQPALTPTPCEDPLHWLA